MKSEQFSELIFEQVEQYLSPALKHKHEIEGEITFGWNNQIPMCDVIRICQVQTQYPDVFTFEVQVGAQGRVNVKIVQYLTT